MRTVDVHKLYFVVPLKTLKESRKKSETEKKKKHRIYDVTYGHQPFECAAAVCLVRILPPDIYSLHIYACTLCCLLLVHLAFAYWWAAAVCVCQILEQRRYLEQRR